MSTFGRYLERGERDLRLGKAKHGTGPSPWKGEARDGTLPEGIPRQADADEDVGAA